jgi:hypothetical protein
VGQCAALQGTRNARSWPLGGVNADEVIPRRSPHSHDGLVAALDDRGTGSGGGLSWREARSVVPLGGHFPNALGRARGPDWDVLDPDVEVDTTITSGEFVAKVVAALCGMGAPNHNERAIEERPAASSWRATEVGLTGPTPLSFNASIANEWPRIRWPRRARAECRGGRTGERGRAMVAIERARHLALTLIGSGPKVIRLGTGASRMRTWTVTTA